MKGWKNWHEEQDWILMITKTDSPLPTFKSDEGTKIALGICTAGIALFGIVSCIYEWTAAAG